MTTAQWSPQPGNFSLGIPTRRPPGCSSFPKLCSALLFRWLSVQGRSRNSQSILRATHPRGTSSREPQTDTLRAPRPRPRQAARSVTHLLARLGRRVVTGCGAGCSCHGVGQILGRSIRLGVIHHLRTTHGSRGSGGPGAAAAALWAGATGSAAASVAAPAAIAAKTGPRRPRAPRAARAREELAVSGGPCAGTLIFSPSGCPLACAYIATRGRNGPPRGGDMTVRGSGAHRRASRCGAPAGVGQTWGAGLWFAYTQCTPGARPITGAPGWARTRRRGQWEGAGREGEGALSSPGLTRSSAKFLQLGRWRAGRPAGGPRGGPAADWSEVGSPLRLPAVGWWWEGMVCERLHALTKAPRIPSPSPVTWPPGRGLPSTEILQGTPT